MYPLSRDPLSGFATPDSPRSTRGATWGARTGPDCQKAISGYLDCLSWIETIEESRSRRGRWWIWRESGGGRVGERRGVKEASFEVEKMKFLGFKHERKKRNEIEEMNCCLFLSP